jgi:exodeoxyribonuclease-3
MVERERRLLTISRRYPSAHVMKIATFNINGINQRLEALLEWLATTGPDVACLQELKADDRRFPAQAIRDAGYGVIWHGQVSWNGVAILAKGTEPIETRRGLPGSKDDVQSRYIEAAVNGVLIGCLYLPNGNPQPGPKFAYKLAWFERLNKYAASLMASRHPVALCGDFNVVPTDFDIYDTKSWKKNALLQPESRAAYSRLIGQGWTDSLRQQFPDERIYTFWDYFRNHWQKNSGLRIDHVLLSPILRKKLRAAGVDRYVRDAEHASDHAPVWVELDDVVSPKSARKKKSSATKKKLPLKAARRRAPAA